MTETTEVTLDDSEGSKDLSDRAGEAPEGMDEQAFGDSVDDLEALPGSARRALAALLTNRFITRTGNRAAWEALLDHEPRIRSRLADLFLDLVVDRDYDVAFKRQSDKEDVPVMLRRDRPLTREATLLLVHMRQLHAYTDSQDDPVLLPLDAITDFLAQFRAPQDTDDARFDKRVESAINALNSIGLLKLDPDDEQMFVVSPAVVPLVSPEVLAHMRSTYLSLIGTEPTNSGEPDQSDRVSEGENERPACEVEATP
jgi:hypothetical protein